MATFHVMAGGVETQAPVIIRKITIADLFSALRQGIEDFWEKPSHYVFLALIYPVVGVVLAMLASGQNALPLLYPLVSGFALVGPFAAIGLYEISRRREQHLDTSWRHAFEVLRSPSIPSIAALGLLLVVVFLVWLYTAQTIYESLFGEFAATSIPVIIDQVFNTAQGRTLFIVGNAIGFIFALVVLATTAIAFPLLLDRDVGLVSAIGASLRAMIVNPVPMLAWGLIVAVLVALGSLPFFVGLAVVMPILGHATWHLYRKIVPRAS
jgi:uncharacterized membrane protein